MRATLKSTYDAIDYLIPDDAKIGDTYTLTATATITEITSNVRIGDHETSGVLTLTDMSLA